MNAALYAVVLLKYFRQHIYNQRATSCQYNHSAERLIYLLFVYV